MMRMFLFMGLALLLAGCTKTIKEADAGRAPRLRHDRAPLRRVRISGRVLPGPGETRPLKRAGVKTHPHIAATFLRISAPAPAVRTKSASVAFGGSSFTRSK